MVLNDAQKIYIGTQEVSRVLVRDIQIFTTTITPPITAPALSGDPFSDYVTLLLRFEP